MTCTDPNLFKLDLVVLGLYDAALITLHYASSSRAQEYSVQFKTLQHNIITPNAQLHDMQVDQSTPEQYLDSQRTQAPSQFREWFESLAQAYDRK